MLQEKIDRYRKLANQARLALGTLEARSELTPKQQEQRKQLREQLAELDANIADNEGDLKRTGHGDPVTARIAGATRINHPSPDGPSAIKERDPAMRALDRAVKDGRLPAHAAETVETLLNVGTTAARSWTARWAATAGSDDYAGAFAKLVANPTQGHLRWTPQEAESFRAVEALRDERRAMGEGAGDSGGYMLPTYLDPTILLTSAGSINPLRQISRQVQITTDTWHGVSSAGVTAEWIAEGTEVADASPTLSQPSIPVYKADAFVPFSFEVANDALNFTAELQRLLIDGAEQLTATAFTTGSGSGQPTGLITSLVAASTPVVTGTGSEALAAADIYALQNALPPRFQANAVWNANLSILNTIRQLETTNGALKFPELSANPPSLLGRGVYENSNMDGVINPAVTANNYVLAYGDFSEFVIVHRIGSTLELIPNLFGANRRPTGQRGALLWFRVGSDVVVPNAFRVLNVPTAA